MTADAPPAPSLQTWKPSSNPVTIRVCSGLSALAAAERPESVVTYVRGARARDLLVGLGRRELALTHEAFDALPRSTAAEHLRALLVHHNALPSRGDDSIARFKSWLTTRLGRV